MAKQNSSPPPMSEVGGSVSSSEDPVHKLQQEIDSIEVKPMRAPSVPADETALRYETEISELRDALRNLSARLTVMGAPLETASQNADALAEFKASLARRARGDKRYCWRVTNPKSISPKYSTEFWSNSRLAQEVRRELNVEWKGNETDTFKLELVDALE